MTQPTWEGPIPTSGRQRRGVLAPVLGLIALGICGLVVLGLVASSVGVGGVVVGALCALVPVALVVASFLWIDRWEPEPPRLLLLAFLWGACFAALSALVINSSAALIADEVLGRGSGDVVGAVAIAPIVEEAVKGAFLVGLLIFRRREFDGIVDGIVYAGLVAAGFAFTENILYFGRAFTEEGPLGQAGGVFAVLVMRGLLSPFAHPLFTAMTGIGAGIASNSRNPVVRIVAVLIGYAVAVTLHALWNGSASLQGGEAFIGVYAFIMVPLFLAMIAVVLWQRRREQRIVIEQLPGFAQAGWIAPSEIALLSSLAGRRGWRAAVRASLGQEGGQGGQRLPGRGHRPGLPPVPDGPRLGRRRDRCVLAPPGPRGAVPGPRPGDRAPGGADHGAAPPRSLGGLDTTASRPTPGTPPRRAAGGPGRAAVLPVAPARPAGSRAPWTRTFRTRTPRTRTPGTRTSRPATRLARRPPGPARGAARAARPVHPPAGPARGPVGSVEAQPAGRTPGPAGPATRGPPVHRRADAADHPTCRFPRTGRPAGGRQRAALPGLATRSPTSTRHSVTPPHLARTRAGTGAGRD